MSRAWTKLNRKIVGCEECPRLIGHCRRVSETKRKAYQDDDYWGKPVANFGDPAARLLIVGLAPGAHGANRTGRMFTGDRSGDWLFRALHRTGFASQAESSSQDDGLHLTNCAITAACHCAPPDNKPSKDELESCQPWLVDTFDLHDPTVIVALGGIAWRSTVSEIARRQWLMEKKRPKFGHDVRVQLDSDRLLIGSYHPSQQNTFTGRLTEPMLDSVFAAARDHLSN
jgi:uracil-DNA glycosylase